MMKVLVVEDEQAHAALIEDSLAGGGPDGMDVTVAHTLEEAANLLEVLRFECMVLDHSLPDGLGTHLMERCEDAVSSMPVIGLSSSEDPKIAIADLRAGCVDFLLKHEVFRDGSLRRRVREAIAVFERRRERIVRRSQPVADDVFGQIQSLLVKSRTDPLMGILNRAAFEEIGHEWHESALRDREVYGVCMIDVDNFKKYNDRYGHVAGDRVLTAVAQVLRAQLRERDTIARYGGEEIVALLADASDEGLWRAGERLRAGVQALQLEHADNHAGVVTISLGLTASRTREGERDQTLTDVVDRADRALYEAKETGRNRLIVRSVGADGRATATVV